MWGGGEGFMIHNKLILVISRKEIKFVHCVLMESNDLIKVGKQAINTFTLKQIYIHGLSRITI